MERESIISQLYDKDRIFDFVVIGGGLPVWVWRSMP